MQGCSSGVTLSSLQQIWCKICCMSYQFYTNPCLIGFFKNKTFCFSYASSPMYESRCSIPTIIDGSLGLPTTEGNCERGASSAERPALVKAVPASITIAYVIFFLKIVLQISFELVFIKISLCQLYFVNFGIQFYVKDQNNQHNPGNNFIESGTLAKMLNKTAYLNGLMKEKEIEIYMGSHKNNLRNMKSINHNEPEIHPIEINKKKAKYLQGRRTHEINIENEILTQKIQKIVNSSRNPKYHSSNQKYSKSLNGYIKRTNQSQVNQENLKLLVRLQESKPTYSTKKYLEEFEHLKMIEKKMSTAEFYLTDSPTFRKRKLLTNRSFLSRRNSSFGQNSSVMGQKDEIVKQSITLNDGKMWEIKIYKNQKEVTITGEIIIGSNLKDQNIPDLKLISIPNIEANLFLRKHCDNKLNHLIKHLKVDEKDGSLMIIVPQNIKLPSPSKLMNPEQKINIEKNLMNIELAPPLHKRAGSRQIFNTVNKKPLLEELPKFNSQKDHSQKLSEVRKPEESIQKSSNKDVLPKLESKKNVANKEEEITKKKEEIEEKVPTQEKRENTKTKKSSASSIKSTKKENKQLKNLREEQKDKTIKKEESSVKKEEQENYEEQKFEESMNKEKEVENEEVQKNEEPIKDKNQESVQNIKEVEQGQNLLNEKDNQMKTPVEESMDKPIENEGQKGQEQEVQKEAVENNNESDKINLKQQQK